MERTLQVLNELERDGVLSRYAIGGAMGATFYVEPLLTFDLDIIVLLPETKDGLLTLTPLYEALRAQGYAEEGECVVIEGVPVQFLPAYNALLEEALREAREMPYQATSTRVIRVELLWPFVCRPGERRIVSACGFYVSRPRWITSIWPWFSVGINWKGVGRNGPPETRDRKAFSRQRATPGSACSLAVP